jgi:5'-deoxynucleotidase YfbR-like HD superfamily hydrolase
MTTAQEREFIQLYRDADEARKVYIMDLLCCFVYCGEEFMMEIQEAQAKGKEAILATVAKWKATIPAEVAI